MKVVNIIINNVFLLITFGFMVLYFVSLILNLVRANKVLKIIKNNPKIIRGKVVDVVTDKKYAFVKVKYISPTNQQTFTDTLQFTISEFQDQYYVDQEVEIKYPDVSGLKKVYYFPKFVENQKIKIEKGPLFTDILLTVAGIFIFAYVLYQMISTPGSFSGDVALATGGIFTSGNQTTDTQGIMSTFAILMVMVIYVILFNYVLERLISSSVEHTHNYLKICGVQCTAKVVTYKFGRSKDAKGNKESQLKIEFYDNGDLIQASLNSYLYTESQDEYIKILYDPKNPKVTVYIR